MNRRLPGLSNADLCVPPVRGDEPQLGHANMQMLLVFPPYVGMNRICSSVFVSGNGVPPVRGDEPLANS